MIFLQRLNSCQTYTAILLVIVVGSLLYTQVSVKQATEDDKQKLREDVTWRAADEPDKVDKWHEHELETKDDKKSTKNDLNDRFWNWSFNKKSQFQKEKVKEYCKTHGLSDTTLPSGKILLHTEKEVAFCYIPKSACTTFKILFLHTQGLLPDNYLDYNKQMQPRVQSSLFKILLRSVDETKRKKVMRDYFKFVMFRHPLERLLSGYRSKMSLAMRANVPETDRDIETNLFLKEKEEIIAEVNPKLYKKWMAKRQSFPVNITFSNFVNYWLKSKSLSNNPHFNTLVKSCKPCSVNYDYFGNFKTFKEDSEILLESIGASEDEVRPQYPESSDMVFDEYYSQLSDDLKIKIVQKLAPDLKLYYMLFPPENDSHKFMLHIDYNL